MPLIHTYPYTHSDFEGILVGDSVQLFCWLGDIALSVFFRSRNDRLGRI